MRYVLLLLMVFMTSSVAEAKTKFPDRGHMAVYDPTHTLSTDEQVKLNQQLTQWQIKTKHQAVVAIIPDLQGLDIATYGYQLGRAWHLGQTGQDDGILLLIQPQGKTAKARIEVGAGLESVMTDAQAKTILSQTMNPAYKKDGFAASLSVGISAITSYIDAHAKDIAIRHRTAPGSGSSSLIIGVFGIFILGLGVILIGRKKKPAAKTSVLTKHHYDHSFVIPARVSPSNSPTCYNKGYDIDYPGNDFLTGAIAGAVTSSLLQSDDDDNRQRSDAADVGFTSDNNDSDNFLGGGSDFDLGSDDD